MVMYSCLKGLIQLLKQCFAETLENSYAKQ
jgi:hypothetical protein